MDKTKMTEKELLSKIKSSLNWVSEYNSQESIDNEANELLFLFKNVKLTENK